MSVFAFGAMYGGTEDVTSAFLQLGVACIGWEPSNPPTAIASPHDGDAPFPEGVLHSVKAGDLALIKSFSPSNGLRIKAVGIITDPRPHRIDEDAHYPVSALTPGRSDLGYGVKVRWVWPDVQDGTVFWSLTTGDRGDHGRTGTLYEEFGPEVIAAAIDLLFEPERRQ